MSSKTQTPRERDDALFYSMADVKSYAATVGTISTTISGSGMISSVDVRIEVVENAVIIPADALHRTSSSYYVYTSYDEATGEYGEMREVTPGVLNSNYVEIISGLSENDTVWYAYYDILEISNKAE